MYSLILGGLGFIGLNYILKNKNKKIICVDNQSYAANVSRLKDLKKLPNFKYFKANISNQKVIKKIFNDYKIESIINFAAETHVDNSILNPKVFVERNILDFVSFLQIIINLKNFDKEKTRFLHISTDEVYGSLKLKQRKFFEEDRFYPNSPYSASKASAEHFLRAFSKTYGLKYMIANPSNNFGAYQNKEKFIPTIIKSAIQKKKIPIYGKGLNIREWLYVEDNCRILEKILKHGKNGHSYNVGGNNEINNITLVKKVCKILNHYDGSFDYFSLISYVKDRPGHDFRYSVDTKKTNKLINNLKFNKFNVNLKKTVVWYLQNKASLK